MIYPALRLVTTAFMVKPSILLRLTSMNNEKIDYAIVSSTLHGHVSMPRESVAKRRSIPITITTDHLPSIRTRGVIQDLIRSAIDWGYNKPQWVWREDATLARTSPNSLAKGV